ncbi:hypothetical protein D3Z36_11315 [Lachnospiraceae bacterium]|nr:hypothetical protein [Lachnospiraceae bacterium]
MYLFICFWNGLINAESRKAAAGCRQRHAVPDIDKLVLAIIPVCRFWEVISENMVRGEIPGHSRYRCGSTAVRTQETESMQEKVLLHKEYPLHELLSAN